jgi:hypothetical protein
VQHLCRKYISMLKKFSGKKFKRISRGNGRNRVLIKARVLATTRTFSRKIILMTTPKLVRGVVVTITQLESATLLSIWSISTKSMLESKFMRKSLKHTSLLTLRVRVAPRMFLRNTTRRRIQCNWTNSLAQMT